MNMQLLEKKNTPKNPQKHTSLDKQKNAPQEEAT